MGNPDATLEMSAGTQVLFSGTRAIEVTTGGRGTEIPLQYVGPGILMTSLRIEPRDSALRPGEAFTYRVHAFNGPTRCQISMSGGARMIRNT